MAVSSHKLILDNRLLAVEELIRQRRHEAARKDLRVLSETDFSSGSSDQGLFLALQADSAFQSGDYRKALELGVRGARILADYPLNRRYARVLHVLSKCYSAIGDLRHAEIKAYDSLASYRRAADSVGQVDGLNELARIAFMRSDYPAASGFLDEAVALLTDNPRKVAQLSGNAGRIRLLHGEWEQAEKDLRCALDYFLEHDEPISQAINLLSLGYLHLRRREFVFADRSLTEALEIIDREGLKREKVIYLEYAGEMALEKGDLYRAKALLTEAYQQGRLLAPESSLVSQSGRRLAEVELLLDNVDDAMKYAQKALELAVRIGEQAEIGLAQRVIAQVFASRSEFAEAQEYARQAVEVVRAVGDPVDLGRTLLAEADLLVLEGREEMEKVRGIYDEAARIFRKLKLDYWLAEADYKSGVFACQQGNLSRGFKKLSRSEKLFTLLGETAKVRRVNQFLTSLADQAVALSVSDENQLKVVGNLISRGQMKGITTGQMDEVLHVLRDRCKADRVIILAPDFDQKPIYSSLDLTSLQAARFGESFCRLLGEEINNAKPTLLLDCRRDPYINELFPDVPEAVASVVVVPFRMSDNSTSYLYLDKLSVDSALNPFSQEELNFAVGFSDVIALKSAELQKMQLQQDNARLKAQLQDEAAFPNIITRNHALRAILDQVRQVIDSNITISIEGETGCGKDILARAIHYNSQRRDKRFISVNCAALPETLLESELFGYRRGAFTGADRDKPGLFEEADGGTFFLDEIADMPLSIQAKILRVLEERELVRLGESVPRPVDVRILSATNKDLREEMAANRFRQDLYYRLSALTFRLPPLRERREDISLLVDHFLGQTGKQMTADTMRFLVEYDWPGNVRELENETKKLVLLSGDNELIEKSLLSAKIKPGPDSRVPSVRPVLEGGDEVEFTTDYSLYDYLASHERRFIIKALRERKGVKKHAAALLNIPESTLRLKIKEYQIDLKRLDAVN
ncbi:MAG: sigma 54-interacting transcriptional regulator [candidate division Zixibacteria bacterium]|nr:sigma 54-interacting transcriptional regulator [candidate division Zixibacteria bacterium]